MDRNKVGTAKPPVMLKQEPENVVAQLMLGKLDPAIVKLFRAVQTRTRHFAEDQLNAGCSATVAIGPGSG